MNPSTRSLGPALPGVVLAALLLGGGLAAGGMLMRSAGPPRDGLRATGIAAVENTIVVVGERDGVSAKVAWARGLTADGEQLWHHDFDGSGGAVDVVVGADGTIAVTGNQSGEMWLAGLSSSGEEMWRHGVAVGTVRALSTQGDGYLLAGGPGLQTWSSDANGHVGLNTQAGEAQLATAAHVGPAGILVVGHVYRGNKKNSRKFPRIRLLDDNGTERWDKESEDDSRMDSALVLDDRLVVGGADQGAIHNLTLWELDLEGERIRGHSSTYGQCTARDLAATDDGYVAVGSNGHLGTQGWVMVVDSAGEVQWEKLYGGDSRATLNSVAVAPEGDLLVAGHKRDKRGYVGWVMRLAPDGAVRWYRDLE